MPAHSLAYPETPRRPVVETVGGVTFEDPYQWLEEETPEIQRWQEEQDALAGRFLREWPGFAALRDVLIEGGRTAQLFAPQRCGESWFQLVQPDPERMPVLQVSDTLDAPGRVLIDPNALSGDGRVTLDWFYPSPDGGYVVYGLSERGDEQSVLRVLETASGRTLPEHIPFAMQSVVAWLPDASGFYYSAGRRRSTEEFGFSIFFHRPGAEPPAEPEPVAGRGGLTRPQISDDGRYVAAIGGHLDTRPDYLLDRRDGRGWRPFLRDAGDIYAGVFVGDDYVAVTTDGAPRGRLVAIPVAGAGDRATGRELLPEGEAVLQSVALVGDRLVLGELVDAASRLRVLTLDGSEEGVVPLPGRGVVSPNSRLIAMVGLPTVVASRTAGEITFVYQSLTEAPAIYRYALAARRLERLTTPPAERREWVQRQASCLSSDGARVPLSLVHRADLDLAAPRPAVIYAYGGFNVSLLPSYYPDMAPLIESGGIFVLVHARGGGEYGRAWWHAGRLARKQQTFDDVYAAAEWLIAEGVTAADRLGLYGGSNGGLLAGVAVTQRPALFRAVVALIPILDLLRVGRDPWTESVARTEYGTPRDPSLAPTLLAYSPYHNVRAGAAFPATLVVAGETDVRCPPWHSRKFVARLQGANAAGTPVLLRLLGDAGHMTGLSVAKRGGATAEWLGFLMRHIGLEPQGAEPGTRAAGGSPGRQR